MWPFKKKLPIKEIPQPVAFESVICIPVKWNDREEMTASIIAANNGQYIAAGPILMDMANERDYTIEVCERDERMKEAFRYAGMVMRVSDDFLNEIDQHTYVVYISGTTGSLEEAKHIAFTAAAILKAGGIGVKIETAGKAFEKEQWFQALENFEPANLYKLFVLDSILRKDGSVYSCGMQNLGYKDTIVAGEEFQQAVALISLFGYYQIMDEPIILHNQTFNAEATSPLYRITDEPDQPYLGDALFGNPLGMWRLTRI